MTDPANCIGGVLSPDHGLVSPAEEVSGTSETPRKHFSLEAWVSVYEVCALYYFQII